MEVGELRKELREHLGKIIEISGLIDEIMEDLPHSRGAVHRSLKPCSRDSEHIYHSSLSYSARMRPIDGEVYNITVQKEMGGSK